MKILGSEEIIAAFGLPYFRELSTFGALSDEIIVDLLSHGTITHLSRGEYISRTDEIVNTFQVVLQGRMAYYKSFAGRDVLTRHFCQGQQVGFDEMIGLITQNGTDVATEDSIILEISSEQFYRLHLDHPADFGLFMINLARELAREIELLEEVIGKGTGWSREGDS